jgi:type IX secretion system PorP/SprF family membrane protein
MTKYFLHIVIFFCLVSQLYAQEDGVVALNLPVRNSLKFNRQFINPTFSFVREQNKYISFTNKREWTQFDDAPQTYLFGYSGRFRENIGAGISLFQQDYGVLTTFGGNLNFAYNAVLDRYNNLTFGLNLSFYKSGINEGNVIANFPDPSLENIPSNSLLTVNPGINYGTEFFDIGLSLNNLVAYNFTNSELIEENPEQSIQAHAMYTGYFNSRGFFDESKFSGLVSAELKKNQTIISGLMMVTVPKGFWGQVGYNTFYGISAGVGFNISAQIAIEYNYEKAIGELSALGNSHDIILAYKFKNRNRYDYSGDDEEAALIIPEKKNYRTVSRRSTPTRKSSSSKKTQNTKVEPATAKSAVANTKTNDAKVEVAAAAILAKERQTQLAETEKQKAAEEVRVKAEQEKQAQLAEAERIRAAQETARLAEAVRVKAEQEKQAQLAEAERIRAAKETARLAEAARVKVEQEKQVQLAEAERVRAAQETARLAEEARVKAEQEKQVQLAKAERVRAVQETARLAEAARVKAEQEKQVQLAEAERIRVAQETARLAEAARVKAEQEKQVQLAEAEKLKAAAAEALITESKDADVQEMNSLSKSTEETNAVQKELISKLTTTINSKQKDLDNLKEENDLSEQGIVTAPKAFKSISAENAALESLKVEIDDAIKIQTKKITDLEKLYQERLKKNNNTNDVVNKAYQNKIQQLKKDHTQIVETKEDLLLKLDEIKVATEIERKRRIKRALYDNEEDRYQKDRSALNVIKQNTPVSSVPLNSEDFDYGEELNNIQIVKDVKNVESGYYLVIAVHSDVEKRDAFLKKAVAAGQADVNFFYDVNTSKYYIYYDKFTGLNQAQDAMQTKGDKPYNGKMSMVKIEN